MPDLLCVPPVMSLFPSEPLVHCLLHCIYICVPAFSELGGPSVRAGSLWRHLPKNRRRYGWFCERTGSKGDLHAVWTFSECPCPYMVGLIYHKDQLQSTNDIYSLYIVFVLISPFSAFIRNSYRRVVTFHFVSVLSVHRVPAGLWQTRGR